MADRPTQYGGPTQKCLFHVKHVSDLGLKGIYTCCAPPLKVCLSILGDAWAPSLTLKVVRFVRLRLVHVCEMWLRHAHVCVV